MKTKATRSRRLSKSPNNRKLRALVLHEKYSHKLKKKRKNKSLEEKMIKIQKKKSKIRLDNILKGAGYEI